MDAHVSERLVDAPALTIPQAGVSPSTAERQKRSQGERLPAYSVHMDAIRALAAFVVTAGHARMLLFDEHPLGAQTRMGQTSAPPSPASKAAAGLGHHAVIVFFVLSGFLVGNGVWRALKASRWSWRRYLLQRMTRLWIVLLPALVIGGCLDRLGLRFLAQHHGLYSGPDGLGSNLLANSTMRVLVANAFFLQTIRTAPFGTNAALWSLANEFWYYMAFPPLLLALTGGRPAWQRVAYLALCALILVGTGSAIALLFPVWMLGFLVSVAPLRVPPRWLGVAMLAAAIQFLACNAFFRMHRIEQSRADLALGASFALCLYAIVHARNPVRSVIYQHLAKGFARFSYTLYLVHLPLLTLMTGIILRPWKPWTHSAPHLLAAVVLVVVTYAYAYCIYMLFERRTEDLRGWLKRRWTALAA